MDRNSELDLIEKYLNDELTTEEKQGVDRRLATDKALADEFTRRQTAHKALDYLVAKNLKAQLQELEEQEKIIPIARKRRSLWAGLSVAASVLLLAGFFYLLFPHGKMTNPELAASYYEMPDFNSRGGEAALPGQELLTSGLAALQNSEYAAAVAAFESIPENDPYYLTAQYYLAHALYLTGQYERAAEKFAGVAAANDLRYREEAEWYGLLSCLAQNADCSAPLNDLVSNAGHAYHHQALKISKRSK